MKTCIQQREYVDSGCLLINHRPRVLSSVPEQIHNMLNITGQVKKTIPYNIQKVPENTP